MPLLGTEPESSQQTEKDIEQQEAHTYTIITKLVKLNLLVGTTDVNKAADVTDVDISYTKLLLAISLEIVNEVTVHVVTHTDTEFIISVHPFISKQFQIERNRVTVSCLLKVIVTYVLQGGTKAEIINGIAEKSKTVFACHRGHGNIITPIKVVRSQKQQISLFQHLGQLLGGLAPCSLITEHTHEIRCHTTPDGPFG